MVHNAYNTKSDKWKSGKPISHAIRKAGSLIIRNEIIRKARALLSERKLLKATIDQSWYYALRYSAPWLLRAP
jgi:hypothetical protein